MIGISSGFKRINAHSGNPIITVTHVTSKGLIGLEYFNLGINVDCTYTLVLRERFNASRMLVPDIQYLDGISKYQDGTQEDVNTRLGLNAETRFQIAYNSRKFFEVFRSLHIF